MGLLNFVRKVQTADQALLWASLIALTRQYQAELAANAVVRVYSETIGDWFTTKVPNVLLLETST
jgi:hypothetical protein